MVKKSFLAPWSNGLVSTTIISSSILLLAITGGALLLSIAPALAIFSIATCLLGLVVSAVFVVRGYTLSEDTLAIKRLLWSSRVDMSEIVSATEDSFAMDNSVRRFGNGGVFSICGWFRNLKLGPYRAFATDPKRSVVLRFPDRVIVVTPDSPQEFVRTVLANRDAHVQV